MKHLVKQYLDRNVSRRKFLSGLTAAGVSAAGAQAMVRSLAAFQVPAASPAQARPEWMREMHGTGGALLVAQLKAAGIEYIFFNPSTGEAPVYDALVDETDVHLIKALHEGSLAAMADGYAKASGKMSMVMCARPGLPNAMTQMFNSWKDLIPIFVAVDNVDVASLGQDAFEEAANMGEMTRPITKWYWNVEATQKIPEITRRALKFASTAPCGPVFVAFPEDTLKEEATATIMDQSKFDISMKIRPDSTLVERSSRMLIEARNPLLYAGDEITLSGAQSEVLELAELLGLPVSKTVGSMGWSRPFPTDHDLYLGEYQTDMRHPGAVDVLLNLGSRMPYAGARLKIRPGVKLIEMRTDPTNLARTYPAEVAMVADIKVGVGDLLAAVKSMATASRLKQIADERRTNVAGFTQQNEFYQRIAKDRWDRNPISVERLGGELEQFLDRDSCFVAEIDSGRTMESLMKFGGANKQYFSNGGRALGWGVPAGFGVKLANPNLQVVSIVGDGAFLFSGPQPLWSFARYHAPVTIIILNNQSYNNERNRIWTQGGRQFEVGRDMACYMGDPDMDFAKMAQGFGVEAEVVAEPSEIRPALERAKSATVSGAPYLLDVRIERNGFGALSTWHPGFRLDALRTRKV